MKRMIAAAFAALVFGAASLVAPGIAWASAGDVSTVQLDIERDGVDATLDLPRAALERAAGSSAPGEVSAYLAQHVRLACSSDGRPWTSSPPQLSGSEGAGAPEVVARMHFTRPAGQGAGHENALELTDDAVVAEQGRHRIVVFVRRDFEMAKLDGDPALAGVLHTSRNTLTLLRPDASWGRGMRALFAAGLDRLAVGPGLLLLWLLVLTAPLAAMHGRWSGVRTTRGATRALAVAMAAFVVAHAVSFMVGALGFLPVPRGLLELLIAVSLTLVAFHTVRPLGRFSAAWVSALAGTVHGLAFAATLADLGPFESIASLVMVIVGIEGAQLALVALVAPSLVFLRDAKVYSLLRGAAAAAAACAALVTVAPTPVVLLVALAGLAMAGLAAVGLRHRQRVFPSVSTR